MKANKNKLVHIFIVSIFAVLYVMTSVVSTIHVIDFFALSNFKGMAITLAIAFEVGAMACLAAIVIMEKMNKLLVWCLFILITSMQMMGNTFFAFQHLADYQGWIELFGLQDLDVILQKRILSIISGAILPVVALGFIKALVDYIKPNNESIRIVPTIDTVIPESKDDETILMPTALEDEVIEEVLQNPGEVTTASAVFPIIEEAAAPKTLPIEDVPEVRMDPMDFPLIQIEPIINEPHEIEIPLNVKEWITEKPEVVPEVIENGNEEVVEEVIEDIVTEPITTEQPVKDFETVIEEYVEEAEAKQVIPEVKVIEEPTYETGIVTHTPPNSVKEVPFEYLNTRKPGPHPHTTPGVDV